MEITLVERLLLKTGQALLQQGLNVYVIQLPSGMDPDEYIGKYGNEAF